MYKNIREINYLLELYLWIISSLYPVRFFVLKPDSMLDRLLLPFILLYHGHIDLRY